MLKHVYFLSFVFYFHIFARTYSVKFSTAEKRIIVGLNKNFAANHCVVINKDPEKTFDLVKYLSESNIETGFMTINQFNSFLHYSETIEVNKPHVLVVLDLQNTKESLSLIFNFYNEYHLSRFIWVIFDADENIFHGIYIPYNCEFLNVKTIDENNFEIFEVYNIKAYTTNLSTFTTSFTTSLSTMFYGIWTEKNQLQNTEIDFYSRRFDFNGTLLEGITDYLPCGHTGLCVYHEMVSEMSRVMNFRVFYITVEQYYEIFDKNGTFFYELDVSLYVVHYFGFGSGAIWPIWKTPVFLHIAYKKEYVQGATSAHIQPFKDQLWIAIIAWILISDICILFHNFFIYKVILKQKFIWTNHLFLSFDSFTNQCGTKIPNITVFRISALMTRLVSLLILSVYSATVLSFIKVKSIHLPFEDIEGLVRDGTFRIGHEKAGFLTGFFNSTNDPVLITAREKHLIGLKDMPLSLTEGTIKTCKDSKFALLYYGNDVYRIKKKCKILQIPKSVLVAWEVFMARRNSPYKHVMIRIIKTLRSAGILKKMEEKVNGKKPSITIGEQDSVDFESILLLYKITGYGYIMSVIILMLECIYIWLKKKLNEN